MIPKTYQDELSTEAANILKEYMLVYLAWEERTGKSLTGVLIAEKVNVQSVLIVTKKKASKDWEDLVNNKWKSQKIFEVTTYGKAGSKNPSHYDLVILDEAHNYISSYPKPSKTWLKIKRLTAGKPIVYMSATPHAQGYQMLYHQLALSSWSPWRNYSNFYNWFRTYGKPYTIEVHGKDVCQYDKCDEGLIESCISHLFITKTRKELGFIHEPKDKIHWIELSDETKELYNTLVEDKVLNLGFTTIVADSVMKFRSSLHMLEGGTIKNTLARIPEELDNLVIMRPEKIEDKVLYHTYYTLPSDEKIQYILKHWGDSDDVAIMYNYQAEGKKLAKVFKKAEILQATSYAEGYDLTHKKHLVIYSQDYSTARHTQRRARQANMHRNSEIVVHFLLVKKAISHQVYQTVSVNKQNYVDSRFTREKI